MASETMNESIISIENNVSEPGAVLEPEAHQHSALGPGDCSTQMNAMSTGMFDMGEFSPFSQDQKPRRGLWSVAWSDLMMTMFILFVVLYIYQAANRDFEFGKNAQFAQPAQSTEKASAPQVETLVGPVGTPASPLIGGEADTTRLTHLNDIKNMALQPDKAVRIILPGDLLFDTGQAAIKSKAPGVLREVADAIRPTDYMINVVGHTDNVPIHSEKFATNWELSAIRACVVARFLIEKTGLSPKRFYVSGHSYFQPVNPNDTQTDRSANRRVELILTKMRPGGQLVKRHLGLNQEYNIMDTI